MSFIVRTVSRTADGREIIRQVVHDGAPLTIGRNASNAVHLADLAVEPFHATLTMTSDNRVAVESVGGLGFTVDARPEMRAIIDPARGVELGIGGHRLTVTLDDGAVAVRVERIATLSDVAGEKDERTAFTLRGLLPGKRISAWGFAALVLAAFLVAPLWSWASYHDVKARPAGYHPDTAWSSGPLSQAHHALEGDCQSCHDKAFVSVEDSKCVACHTGIHDHANPRRQVAAMAAPDFGKRVGNVFKAAFGKPTGQRCVDCHSEHQGAGPMPATAQSFCTDCHATMDQRLTNTKLGNVSDFGTAHPAFSPLKVASALKFPHDTHLSRSNGVARMAQTMRGTQGWGDALVCKDCHTATADGVRFQPVEMEQSCQMCHSLGFDRVGGTVRMLRHGDTAQAIADVRALGGRSSFSPTVSDRRIPGQGAPASHGARPLSADALFMKGGACYDCHVVERTGDISTNGWKIVKVEQPMRYLAKGWFDHKAHATESCGSCHAAATSHSANDVLIPAIGKLGDKSGDSGGATCRSCHGGEASSAKVPSGCAVCHDYHLDGQAPWRPAAAARKQVAWRDPRAR